jgi:hypothetical protein
MESQAFFSRLLATELRMRKLTLSGSLEDRRMRLKQYLMVEQKLNMIVSAISRSEEGKRNCHDSDPTSYSLYNAS